jgi:hypothetical protein
MKKLVFTILLILSILTGCDKWYTTEDVSHISPLPQFILAGGEFISISRADSGEFIDPGVTAKLDEDTVDVTKSGSADAANVDVTKTGVYIITYTAQNADGLIASAQRVVAVTNVDVTNNDLSGTYTGTLWDQVESKVKKIDPKGLYKCSEVMGYPGAIMTGKFVDIGNNKLVLINGEGYFGRYKSSEGTYSLSTLSWTISLIDAPYKGNEIPVIWRKKE